MSEFKNYRRKQIAELRPVVQNDINRYYGMGNHLIVEVEGEVIQISISQEDENFGSPSIGDMIARNPKNHKDQWLVAEQYFKDNFEEI